MTGICWKNRWFASLLALAAAFALTASCAGLGEKKKEAKAHYKMGVSYLNAGNLQAAYVEFQKSLDLAPRDKETYNALGIVNLRLEDLKRSEENFKKAVSIDPGYSEAHNNLCFLYYETGRWKDAIRSCEDALANRLYLTPEKAYYNLGRTYYRLGENENAVDALENSIRRSPGQPEAYYFLALSYNAQRMYGKAAEAMEKALKLDPRFNGDRYKAELEFKTQMESSGNPKDLGDLLEILKY